MSEPALRLTSNTYRHNQRQRNLLDPQADMITPEEYVTLPVPIQKKYFSSVERIRLAQQAAVDSGKKQKQLETWSTSMSSADLTMRTPPQDDLPSGSRARRATMDGRINHDDPISEHQARWFLSLPYKFRKQHFSREELLLLTQHSQDVLQGVYSKAGAEEEPSERSSSTSSYEANAMESDLGTEASYTPRTGTASDDCTAPAETEELSRQMSEISRLESELAFFPTCSVRRASTIATTTTTTSAPPQGPKRNRKSFHRASSLTPISLPPLALSPIPSLPKVDIRNFSRLSKSPKEHLRPKNDSEAPAAAKYYRDPDARKTLRTYLASAQKFDEVLEFGFPSSSPAPSMSAGTEGSCSIQRSESAMSRDTVDTYGPTTPTMSLDHTMTPAFYDHGMGHQLHLDECSLSTDGICNGAKVAQREMTIRMTLTRPELRRGSVQPKQSSDVEVAETDPLALEPLPVCEDATGAHGAFAVSMKSQKKDLGRVWKTIRRR